MFTCLHLQKAHCTLNSVYQHLKEVRVLMAHANITCTLVSSPDKPTLIVQTPTLVNSLDSGSKGSS